MWVTLLYVSNSHNIVGQLCFNKNNFLKKNFKKLGKIEGKKRF